TQTGGLRIGVGQHKMIEHVGERLTGDGHSKVFHVREIGLSSLSGRVTLFKDHLLLRSMQRSPSSDMPSQRAILRGTIATRMLFTQQGKQRRGLQRGIAFELLHHPGPVLLKRIFACGPALRMLQFRRPLAGLFILASGSFTHARSRSRYTLGSLFSSFRHIQLDLMIVFHMHTTYLFVRWCYPRPLLTACREQWPHCPQPLG